MEIDEKAIELAGWYLKQMEHSKRDNGAEFWKFREHSGPDGERCSALAHAAHGSMMPDDHRYEFIREALCVIEDASALDEIETEADIYTADLTAWLASRNDRMGFCDDAVSEGLCAEDADMTTRLQLGQYMEKREVLDAVREHLREEAGELIDAEGDEPEEASA